MQTARVFFGFASAIGLFAITAQGPAAADSAAAFYKGTTITAYGEFGEDAAMSVFSRLIAPYVEKYTGATVVVKPMPGAGGTRARNYLYSKAKPDGREIILIAHGPKIITNGLFKLQGVRYDWSKFVPLGKVIASNACVIVAKDSAWNSPSDPANEAFNYGESSPFYGPLIAEALGWEKMAVIPGYRSTTGRAVAISRGELQAGTASAQTIVANPDLVKPLVFLVKDPEFPKVPTVFNSLKPGKQKWGDYIEGWTNIQFVSIAPPGIPQDRAAFLEDALRKTWADEGFRKALTKIKQRVATEFVTADKLKKFMHTLTQLSETEVSEMKRVITQKYKKK